MFGGSGSENSGSSAPAGGLSFGGNTSSSTTGAPLFSFNAGPASSDNSKTGEPSSTGVTPAPSFGASSFNFGGGSLDKSKPSAFSFGGAAPAPLGGISFGGPTPAASTSNEGNGFPIGGSVAATKANETAGGSVPFGENSASTTGNATPTSGFTFVTKAPAPLPVAADDAKPSVATGFSFQSTPASSSTTTPALAGLGLGGAFGGGNSSDGGTTPALATTTATTTGFMFGGTQSEPSGTATTPNAGGGGFSFGGSIGAPSTPGPPETPGPPAPVATPPTTTAPATSTTTAAASTTTASAPVTSTEPIRLEYQTLTVEQILNMFQQEMEKDAVTYLEEARRVAEYDAILRDSERDLNMVTENVRRCLIEQKEVEQTLIGIGAFQSEFDRNLEAVERDVDELFSTQSHLMPTDADMERESAYKMAHAVDLRLQELHASLQTVLHQMDTAQERALTGDVAKIVQILNQHQSSLAALEDAGRRMEQDIAQVNRALAQR